MHVARIDLPPVEDGDPDADIDRYRLWRLRPEFGVAAEAFNRTIQENSILPVAEHEAARIRIAHINGCVPCSEARTEDLEAAGIDESFYEDVDDPARRGRYTVRERLSIEFAERFAEGAKAFDDRFWAEFRANYSDAEIVDLAASCAKWLGLGRLNAVLDLTVACPIRIVPSRHAAKPSSVGNGITAAR
jgi:AhpD family alkylhydroperoxidase